MGFWANSKEPNQLHDAVHRELFSNLAQLDQFAGRQATLMEATFEELSERWGCKVDVKAEPENGSSLRYASPSFVSSAAVCLLLRAELHWEPG